MKTRSYDELVSAIIHAMPLTEEIAALSDEQIQTLRKYGNTFDNLLYLQTREWKEWRAANPPRSFPETASLAGVEMQVLGTLNIDDPHDPKNKELKL